MSFSFEYNQLSTLPVMCTTALGMAIGWGIIMEISKKNIYDMLPKTSWWHFANRPTKSMMSNFGFPKQPSDKFPNGITDSMSQDFFAFLITICSQHFVSAILMLPVLLSGWDEASDTVKSLFIMGTLSDVGFDIYDAVKSTIRTFTKHSDPLPIDWWIIIVAMHHTLALSLAFPMNLNYVHRWEYHQTAFSLLMAAAVCYGLGCYKFTLDIGKKFNFLLYKAIVTTQLLIILYTRVYLWFPTTSSFRTHLKEQNDTVFFYGASIMIGIFSLFNLVLVADGFKAVAKCIPKPFPKDKAEQEKTIEMFAKNTNGLDVGAPVAVMHVLARRKFKGAVKSVIAAKRLDSLSSHSGKPMLSSHSGKPKAQ